MSNKNQFWIDFCLKWGIKIIPPYGNTQINRCDVSFDLDNLILDNTSYVTPKLEPFYSD
jgi:hypothetical protein